MAGGARHRLRPGRERIRLKYGGVSALPPLDGIVRFSAGRYTFAQEHKPPGPSRSGLEESGARTAADAKRPKSIVSEGATRPSLIDFSAAGADVSLSLHSRDLFGSFFDPAKNEHPSLELSGLSRLWARRSWRKRWKVLRLSSQRHTEWGYCSGGSPSASRIVGSSAVTSSGPTASSVRSNSHRSPKS